MTALLEILAGNENRIRVVSMGVTITNAYLPLDNSAYFQTDMTLLECWDSTSADTSETFLRFLGKMLFPGGYLQRVKVLSGRRCVAMIAKMMLTKAMFVIGFSGFSTGFKSILDLSF